MADTPANHVWHDADGKEHPASEKKSMEGAEPALFREEGRPEPLSDDEWAKLNERHLKLEADGKAALVDANLAAGMDLRKAIIEAEKAKAPTDETPTPTGGGE
jgi:hypothetical protein